MGVDWDGSWEDPRPAVRRIRPVLLAVVLTALVAAGAGVAATWTATVEGLPEARSDRAGEPLAWGVGSYPTGVIATVVAAAGDSWTHRGVSESTVEQLGDGCVRLRRSADGPMHLTDVLCGTTETVTLTQLTLAVRSLEEPLVLACEGVVVLGVPSDDGRCSSPGTTATVRTDTRGREAVAVGAQFVPTVRVHQSLEFEGSVTGSVVIDRWFVEGGGPEVRTYASVSWHRPGDPFRSFALLQSAWSSTTSPPDMRAWRRS